MVISMRTYSAKPGEVERKWYVVDASGQTLGRMASRIAVVLRGKHKPQFTPHVDTGDYVIVINADKVRLTGRKLDQKEYYRYSGYLGGLKRRTARQVLDEDPERVVMQAVRGMLPKNKLGQHVTQWYATGRRKEASARVFLRPGTGRVVVNKRDLDDYIPRASTKMLLRSPLVLTENAESFDVYATVSGGGVNGQAGAIQLGISRALCEANPNNRAVLKRAGMLTRDARKVERKKYGQPGARKRFQFSKR